MDELLRALKFNGKTNEISVRTRFRLCSRGEGHSIPTVGIFTTRIDNLYDKELDWRWEIFLHEDGTWDIK